jgi:uncharacterized metal-binding protein
MGCSCNCSKEKLNLIYSCSGSADVGELADRLYRELKKRNIGDGSCLAGLGADLSGFIESARSADLNILIDGCSVSCSKKIFDKNSIKENVKHFIITNFGFTKGKTEITDEIVKNLADIIEKEI